MKKLTVLALFALVALISAPLAAAEVPAVSAEAQAAPVVVAGDATPAVSAAPALPGGFQLQPINLYTCSQLCGSEYSSCKLDCRFQPYPGCANDCWLAYQACLAGC
ncbi:MAG TPA: hypothetical protein VN851_04385 [Thermoanaerobaculia bacterium]|nr:hypothetical protein [Thermoanaerobaculia bacterium]